jgi:hypothetical protein
MSQEPRRPAHLITGDHPGMTTSWLDLAARVLDAPLTAGPPTPG